MGQEINDLIDLKTILAEAYEDWLNDWNDDPEDYNIDYDKESDLLDRMISSLCIHIDEIRDLPLEDSTQD